MILPHPKDARHRGVLYKMLIEIADTKVLAKSLVFKGGTCAAMQGHLDRFSVDLDFDLAPGVSKSMVKNEFNSIFERFGFEIKNQSVKTIQYVVKYLGGGEGRNTLKIDAIDFSLPVDSIKPILLPDIDRYLVCQTIETMFGHKLVAVLDRHQKHQSIAGRDIYDIYYFFVNGYRYNANVIKSRTGISPRQYLATLVDFIQNNVTQPAINEDLNTLLPFHTFSAIRKSLKSEVIAMLKSEIATKG